MPGSCLSESLGLRRFLCGFCSVMLDLVQPSLANGNMTEESGRLWMVYGNIARSDMIRKALHIDKLRA